MSVEPKRPLTIAGSGGKGGGGSGGGVEAPNSLKSKQIARVVDLLSEGPIGGMVNGAKSIFFDGVQLQNDNGTMNFTGVSLAVNNGLPAQPVLKGFTSQQAEVAVGLQLKKPTPLVRTVLDGNTDRVRVTVSVPALQLVDKENGNIYGTTVQFDIHVQSNGGGFQYFGRNTITGKTNTRYQRAVSVTLPGAAPWDIRLTRVTADSTTLELQNDLFWDSFTTIIDAKVNYTLSAVIGVVVDAEQFQQIPKRTYEVNGLYVWIPTNYDPVARTYSGVWDGGFKTAVSNNPAWVFFDLVRNSRYGLGDFIAYTEVDKWALYRIAQWCDGLVPNGKGGWEPRFICNAVINSQQEAFDLVNALASTFRGAAYWAGGMMVPIADMPADFVGQYTNANVIDGTFNYSGSDVRGRHNMVSVSWNDPANLGEARLAIVEDQDGISRYGIQKTDLIAIGCTDESQAIRTGKWLMFSETYEGETVSFSTGLDTAWCRPGDTIQIADLNIAGKRMGGRVAAGSTTDVVWFDSPVPVQYGHYYLISCVLGEGVVQTRQTPTMPITGPTAGMNLHTPFSSAPQPDTIFVVNDPGDLEPTLWRVVTSTQTDADRYQVTAIRQRPDKWGYIERDLALSTPDISDIGAIPAVAGLNAKDYLVALSSIAVGVRMLISWHSLAPSFEVAFRPLNGNWVRLRTEQTALDVEAIEGTYEIWVTPINLLGRRGPTAKIQYTVVGRSAPPADPKNFRVQAVQGVAMFQWAPATELDVIIGGSFEMRWSPRTSGVTWTSSNTVLRSIPGTATTAELPYRPGTYLLRTRDITGLFSKNAAVIVTTGPDTDYKPFFRICEQPDWLGSKNNVEVRLPQNWLVLGFTGGLWDDQADPIDTWPDVDVLPYGVDGPGVGTYTFEQHLDMSGVFPVRLAVDMIAFPFIDGDVFIDERSGLVDDWQDWDDASDDGGGMVVVRVRQTDDDPASPAAIWSNWTLFLAGEYTGRGFQFEAVLNAPLGQNIAIEQLCIMADISAKHDEGADVVWVPVKMHITYAVKFYLIPAISIAVQEGVVGDTFRITNKTREGFDLELIAGSGAIITAARSFDWTASGY
jgi:predicted phage tail protein